MEKSQKLDVSRSHAQSMGCHVSLMQSTRSRLSVTHSSSHHLSWHQKMKFSLQWNLNLNLQLKVISVVQAQENTFSILELVVKVYLSMIGNHLFVCSVVSLHCILVSPNSTVRKIVNFVYFLIYIVSLWQLFYLFAIKQVHWHVIFRIYLVKWQKKYIDFPFSEFTNF